VRAHGCRPTKSIRALVDAVGDRALVGAGTVLTPSDVDAVAAAGGTLIVSPDANEDVIRRTTALGLVSLPGVATPAEAFRALQHGADALKLFPAEAAPPPVLKAIRAVLPKGTRVLVVGGVGCSRASMEPYWGVGAAGFGLGGSLYQPGMSAEEVGTRAAAAVSAARELLGETGG
jgi:2-dehydro-3-deoxyphosphogalactonate aldolase